MNLNNFLSTTAFSFLLLLMLLYWSQAAFFGRERYKTVNSFISLIAILLLSALLIIRWIESGHFPLSNLYESLLFLSWCFLSLKLLFEIQSRALFSSSFSFFEGKEQSYKVPHTSTNLLTKLRIQIFNLYVLVRGFAGKKISMRSIQVQSLALQEDLYAPVLTKNPTFLEFSNLTLGVILSPLSLLTFGFAFLSLPKEMQQATSLVPALQSNWLMMHVTVMVLSYAALLSGSILAIAFLILTRLQTSVLPAYDSSRVQVESSALSLLKKEREEFCLAAKPLQIENLYAPYKSSICKGKENQKVSELNEKELPDLGLTARLDNYSYRVLALGFPLLTIGILSGAVWANEAWGSYWSWDPKETWALITWLVFAIYLHTRITKGWSGEKSAIVASLGFFMVWFCYLGVNLLGTGLHSYGWFSK